METAVYKAALARRLELQKDLARVNWFLAQYGNLSRGQHVTMACPAPSRRITDANPRGINPTSDQVADIAEAVLKRDGRPLRGQELFDQCRGLGLSLFCKRPVSYFTTLLWRSKRFMRTRDGYKLPN